MTMAARRHEAATGDRPLSTEWKIEFMECAECRAKPGMHALCEACLHNRRLGDLFNAVLSVVRRTHFRTLMLADVSCLLTPVRRCSTQKFCCLDPECPVHGR